MPLQIYDVMARDVVPFAPRDEGRVGMYLCGPTVYNYIHIGNARTILWFDFIRRYFVYRGFDVTFVMNYTDVDDKIIERGKLEGLPPDAVTQKYAQAFEHDMRRLGVRPPDILCRATDHVEEMVDAIEGLIEKGAAYEAEGNVWFSVESFPAYGQLSRRTLDEMRAGERIEPHPAKRHPLDFALWKSAKEGEPSWSSPWGPGRPGWHIECSVMSTKYLGTSFDIHGGASDLMFPHHENEIAQAEALTGASPFVRHWMHAGLVQMEAEKMSKSLGNFVLAKDLLEQRPGETLRYWALMGSYRTQMAFSQDVLDDATQGYERWKTFYDAAAHLLGPDMPAPPVDPARPLEEPIEGAGAIASLRAFVEALDDDFNSAGAFAAMHDLVRDGNKQLTRAQEGDAEARAELTRTTEVFLEMTAVLGFEFPSDDAGSDLVAGLVEYLLELRDEARAGKEFDRADAIRAKLQDLGVAIEDTPAGTRWRTGASSTE